MTWLCEGGHRLTMLTVFVRWMDRETVRQGGILRIDTDGQAARWASELEARRCQE